MKPTTTTSKKQAPRRSKDEIEILERAAGAYYLLLNAIMQNKRLSGDITMEWLEKNGYVLMLKEKVNADLFSTHPEYQAMIEKAEAQVAQARKEIEQWNNDLMDLVR